MTLQHHHKLVGMVALILLLLPEVAEAGQMMMSDESVVIIEVVLLLPVWFIVCLGPVLINLSLSWCLRNSFAFRCSWVLAGVAVLHAVIGIPLFVFGGGPAYDLLDLMRLTYYTTSLFWGLSALLFISTLLLALGKVVSRLFQAAGKTRCTETSGENDRTL